ncbi:Hypothetical predicted protein [Xyrichtys novacula]|uniref:Hexosyltransferase n=1 Tax=Xyrichtys novacula TaxID=13765 RepID=A0AAV1HJF6_XYRNO|nr:Hypothetical predicted protein [Xyrichtys novacula]
MNRKPDAHYCSMPSQTAAASPHLTQRWHQRKYPLMWASSLHKYDFLAFIDDDCFLGSTSSVVQCERRERYRTKQRHHPQPSRDTRFLIQSAFNRIV